jgi:hypothetical protein
MAGGEMGGEEGGGYRHQKFTPPRHARELIKATQYEDDDYDDYERDSLGSSQTGSTRIRLQERWRIIGTKTKLTSTTQDINRWVEEHAQAEMAKAGQFEDLRPAPTDVGSFKRAHVSNCSMFHSDNFCDLIRFLSLQGYKSTTERSFGLLNRVQYNCPYRIRCKCYVALSVKEYRDRYVLLQAGEHTLQSHVESSSILRLNPKQKGAVERAARSAPLALGTQIHASMQIFSPGRHIPYDKRSRKAVDRLVCKTRRDVMSRRAGARRGPSLTQYVSDNSKRHADKILLPTGAHRFPMLPTISTSLWVKVQKFDLMRLLLSTSTGSKFVQRQWLDDLDYFHEADTEGKVYTDVIKEFCEAGNRMHVARSTLEGCGSYHHAHR